MTVPQRTAEALALQRKWLGLALPDDAVATLQAAVAAMEPRYTLVDTDDEAQPWDSAGAGSAGRAVKKRMMSSAAVGESIIAWTRADISAIG